jgi:hypothetical protein
MHEIRTPWRLFATALAMAALAACSDDPTTPAPAGPARATAAESDTVAPPPDGDLYPGEQELVELAQKIPGFAGAWYEGDTRVVSLTAEGSEDQASQVLAGFAPAEQAARPENKTGGGTRFVPAQFDYVTLRKFRDVSIEKVLEADGATFYDLDETHNRVVAGIVDEAHRPEVEARFKESGVPFGAYDVVVTGKIEQDITLRDFKRPLEGGWQIQNANGGICTLGFITRNPSNGAPAFVTNSHCTNSYWAYDGIAFSQHLNNLFVGREVRDPGPFRCGIFNLFRCRYSDAALVQVTNAQVSPNRIGRTTYWGGPQQVGSIVIDNANPTLAVTGVQNWPWNGQMVDKVGRTSGWNYGFVTNTCVTMSVGFPRRLLCQYWATYLSQGGDSGSPVFLWHGNNVTLTGINWGHVNSPQRAIFSAAGGTRIDLGVP